MHFPQADAAWAIKPKKRPHRKVYENPEMGRKARLDALRRYREKQKGLAPDISPVSSELLEVAVDEALDTAADAVAVMMSRTGVKHRQLSRIIGRDMGQTLHRLYQGRDVKVGTLAEIGAALGFKVKVVIE